MERPGEDDGLFALRNKPQDTAEKKDKKKDKKDKKKEKKNKNKNEGGDSEDKREDKTEKKKDKNKRKRSGTQETQSSDDDDDFSIVSISKNKGSGGLAVNARPKRQAAEQVTMLRLRDTYNLATRQARNSFMMSRMKMISMRGTARMNRSQQNASKPYLMPANMIHSS